MDLAGPHHHSLGRGAHHKGPGQGGNKSLVSYRVGYGIPGYTGYIPTVDAVPVPSKEGISNRPAKNAFNSVPATAPPVGSASKTLYQNDFTITTEDFEKFAGRTSAGVTAHGAGRSSLSGSQRLQGVSLYRAEFSQTSRTADPLASTVPSRGTKSRLESTYSATFNHVEEIGQDNMAVRLGERETRHRPPPTKREMVNNPAGVRLVPPAEGSTYGRTYGSYVPDKDNRPKHARTATDLNLNASTKELFHGTTKASRHIPHYAGFIPSSSNNPRAAAQGTGAQARANAKDFTLLELDQFPHHVPGYGGYQPTTIFNKRGDFVPSTLTTSGKYYSQHPKYASPEYGILNQMHKDFFQPGQTSQSANGNADAEVFFNRVRPLEGLPRVERPSKETHSGYKFDMY